MLETISFLCLTKYKEVNTMTTKTLSDYLSEATNYLYPQLSEARLLEERKMAISFCEKHGLAEKFLSLVDSDSAWLKLSQTAPVQYFFDYIRILNSADEQKLPDIKIIRCELGKVPVIKISIKAGSLF